MITNLKKNLVITLIGAGKLAYSLAGSLRKNNFTINSIISRNYDSAKALAQKFSVENYSDNPSEISSSNLIIISVPDNQIAEVAKIIAGSFDNFKSKIFIHLSGSQSSKILNPLKSKGAGTASFHILQTFPSRKEVDISDYYCAVETDQKYVQNFLTDFATMLSLKAFFLEPDQKILYHSAAVFASNFINSTLFNSESICKCLNLNETSLIFKNLTETVQKNINEYGPEKALSGPIERGDLDTVKNHIKELKNCDDILLLNYISQSMSLNKLALNKHSISNEKFDEVNSFLKAELKKLTHKLF